MDNTENSLLIIGGRDDIKSTFGFSDERKLHDLIFQNNAELRFCQVNVVHSMQDVDRIIRQFTVVQMVCFIQLDSWEMVFLYDFQKKYPEIAIMGIFDQIGKGEVEFARRLFMEGIFERENFNIHSFSFAVCREIKKRTEHIDAMDIFQHRPVIGESHFLQHTFWRNVILSDRWFDDEEQLKKGIELGVDLKVDDTYILVLLKIDNQRVPEQEKKTIPEYFETCKAYLGIRSDYEIVEISSNKICLIIQLRRDSYEEICNTVSDFIDTSLEHQNLYWTAYTSTVTLLPILRDKYLELEDVDVKNVSSVYKNFLLEDVPLYTRVRVIEGKVWIQYFAEGKTEEIRKELAEFIRELTDNNELNIESMYSIVHRLSMAFYASMEMRKQPVNEILTTKDYLDKFNAASHSVRELYEFLDYLQQYNEKVILNLQNDNFLSIQIRNYIRENIDQDLTREEIAQRFFMSKDYISHVFKKETGQSLVGVINSEKIKRACELLITTRDSVSEIATNLGLTNFSYFTRMFKKETGYSPQEYRKNAWNKK